MMSILARGSLESAARNRQLDSNRINRYKAVLVRSRNPVEKNVAEVSGGPTVTALLRLNNRGKICKKTGHRNTVFLS